MNDPNRPIGPKLDLIAKVCTAPGHRIDPLRPTVAGTWVAVLDGMWSYCPMDAMAKEGHQWRAVGDLRKEDLTSLLAIRFPWQVRQGS